MFAQSRGHFPHDILGEIQEYLRPYCVGLCEAVKAAAGLAKDRPNDCKTGGRFGTVKRRRWPTPLCRAAAVESILATPAARERLMQESVIVADSGDPSRFNS